MKQKSSHKKERTQKIPQSIKPSQLQESQAQLNQKIFQRFQNFVFNQKIKKLKHAMSNYIGRNTPINYHQQFNFQQQWQSKKKKIPINFSQFMHTHNIYIQILALIILIGYCIVEWFISYQVIFHHKQIYISRYFYSIGLLVTILHSAAKIFLNSKNKQVDLGYLYHVKLYVLDLVIVVYFIAKMEVYDNRLLLENAWFVCYDLVFVFLCYKRSAEIYKSFRMKIITTFYKNYFDLFDLLATSLIMGHIFALALFWSADISENDTNWLNKAQIQDDQPIVQYIYSIYFASTTMLTVGYGDLVPVNVIQIIAVLIVQIIGIAIFAYVINEIGHTLSSMRKQEQSLEKDLSSLSKISKYYGLDEELQTKAKAFIMDNRTSINELLPQEEKQFLMKLNDQLRTQINQQNSLKILKSCIFFICHWSKKMQFQMAKKLTKKLFSPNQKLFQNPGRQSIYVIKRGKVQIYTDRHSGLKRHFKKLLKTIQITNDQLVSNNVYGYTSVISSQTIKLNAIAKDFTVVYYIQKNDFIESLMDNQLDFQYFHQIKAKIDSQILPQAHQAPSILNIKQHYRPNIFYVIKKHKKKIQINTRTQCIRDQDRSHKRRLKTHFYDCIQQLQGDIDYRSSRVLKSSHDYITKTKTMTQNLSPMMFQEYQAKCNLKNCFDSYKEYQNYFKRFNMRNILLCLDRENFSQIIEKMKIITMRSIKCIDSSTKLRDM